MASYCTTQGRARAEIVEKKSRFIATVQHVETEEEALAFLDEIRSEHRMARHNVYAYVLRENGRVRYSDDGEPQKTAGMPTLEAIQHAGLTDVAVVVTRYFGGILLGMSRTTAAEFTFFLAVPVMAGASLLKLVKFGLAFSASEAVILLVGMVVAFVVSILVIKFLMNYIRRNDFKVFGWYRIVLGVLVFLFFSIL